jgi:hypothetical protein
MTSPTATVPMDHGPTPVPFHTPASRPHSTDQENGTRPVSALSSTGLRFPSVASSA